MICEFHQRQLSILNEYVKMMQLDIPLVHRLYPEMKRLVRRLCSSFMRPEKMKMITKETVLNTKNHISPDKVFEGLPSSDNVSQAQLSEYGKVATSGLVQTSVHLIEKLPFNNELLKSFQGLDPASRGTERCVEQLSILIKNIPVSGNDKGKALHEARQYASDNSLPPFDGIGIDEFWAKVEKLNRYPNLCAVVKAAITCFNGPKVEGAFTLMNKTATEFRSSMTVRTLSAILSAQYRNKLYGSSVSQLPANPKTERVPEHLLRCMQSAWKKCLMDQRAKQLVARAAANLTEKGKEKRDEERLQRKAAMAKRRKALERMIPGLAERRRRLANLPPIPRTQENETPASCDDLTDSESLYPCPNKKPKLQSDIRQFFRK